jgi:glutathione S-transferase
VPCERVRVDIQKGETRAPAFLALNPNGRVPCLVHDGVPVWESAAITMYLGETFGVDRGLYPALGVKRGEAMKWIVWTNVTLGDAVRRFTSNTMEWLPAEMRNAAAGEAGKQDMAACLAIVDAHLEGRSFLVGEQYSLADTHLSSFTDWLRHMRVDFGPYPRLSAWSARCAARPAYQRVMSGA